MVSCVKKLSGISWIGRWESSGRRSLGAPPAAGSREVPRAAGWCLLDPVLLGVLGEHDGVVDLVDVEPLGLKVLNPRSREPF